MNLESSFCYIANTQNKGEKMKKLLILASVAYGIYLVVRGMTIPGCVIIALALM